MNKKLLLKIVIVLFSAPLFSQNFTLKGTLKNENEKLIPNSNILLLSKDTLFIKGTASDSKGLYVFDKLKKDAYFIKVTHLEHEEYLTLVNLENENTTHNIMLKNDVNNLNEVTIQYKKPVISQKTDRLVFNIENTILSTKNAWDILINTPTVFIDQDNISVKNSATDVYINDKKIQLNGVSLKSYLAGLDGNNIKSIEIIDNPPAKYDADSNSILNIILKKRIADGYKGSVSASHKQGLFAKFNFATSHFYTTKKWNLFANYSVSPRKDRVTMDEFIYYKDGNNEIDRKLYSFYDVITRSVDHNIIFNVDYKINDKSKLSLSTSHYLLPDKTTANITSGKSYNSLNELTGIYEAQSPTENNQNNLFYALDYKRDLKKKGESITLGVSYNYYDINDSQNITTDYFTANNVFTHFNKFKVNSNQNIEIYTGQVDYSLPLENKVNLEIGAKTSQINSFSANNHSNFDGSNYIVDLNNSDEFNFEETNFAGYTSINKTWKKWYAKFGLRAEQTYTKGISQSLNITDKNDYFKLFPTAYISYFPSPLHDFSLNYGKRIQRPNFRNLNPFKSYFSDFTVNLGDPKLEPAISHKLDFYYLYKRKHRFNLFYTQELGKIQNFSFQDNTNNILQFIAINMDKRTYAGFSYFSNFSITKRWSASTQYMIFGQQNEFKAIDASSILVQTDVLWRNIIQISNNFTLLKDKSLTSSVDFAYATPTLRGSYVQQERTYVHINFSKKILKNRATINLNIMDIFNTSNLHLISNYRDQNNGFLQKNETRTIKLGFVYNFGNKKLRENKATKKGDENKRL